MTIHPTKSAVELLLGNRWVAKRIAAIRGPMGLVLAFHNIISVGTEVRGDRSLHLPFNVFCEILDWLSEQFCVVALDQVNLRGTASGNVPTAAITFDDAYAGALLNALPELSRRGLPSTVFVVSDAECGQTFWWDALADDYPDGLPTEIRRDALLKGRGRQHEVLRWAAQEGHSAASLDGEFVAASWPEIHSAASIPGVAIASHTRTHANLCALPTSELAAELSGSLQDLRNKIPTSKPWLTYPYGLHTDDVESAAAEAGYELAFRVTGGVVVAGDRISTRLSLPRLNVPAGISQRGFRIRAAGLLRR